jgi:hypothetical protein
MKELTGQWFTLTQLQDMLDLTDRSHLRERLLAAGVPCRALGRELYFATDQFVEWIKAGTALVAANDSEAA